MSFGNKFETAYKSRGGRGGRGGSWRGTQRPRYSQTQTKPAPQEVVLPPTLGEHISFLKLPSLTGKDDQLGLKISGCEFVSSYSWLDTTKPTILIPGQPAAWTPLTQPKPLKEDQGHYFRDPNAARYPSFPTLPAVESVLSKKPNLDFQSIDVFGCASTLGNLLRFASGADKSFSLVVDIVGKTAFFLRRELSPTELIEDVRGYGHTFPETYTTYEAKLHSTLSHQRIIKYDFAGMEFLVRFQSDGYLKNLAQNDKDLHVAQKNPTLSEVAELTDVLSKASLGSDASHGSRNLSIENGGICIPQKAVFELKTRSIFKRNLDVLGEELPRLWLAQVPNFIAAYHHSGLFKNEDIEVHDARRKIADWERNNESILRSFAHLIKEIISVAMSSTKGRIEVRRTKADELELREVLTDDFSALPPDMRRKWAVQEDNDGGVKVDQQVDVGANEEVTFSGKEPDYNRAVDAGDGPNEDVPSDEESEKDYTACSEDCGYCGHCTY